jgi:peptide/nickel transport system substrate-binding protein
MMRRLRLAMLLVLVAACGERTGSGSGERTGGIAVYCAGGVPGALNPFVTPDVAAADLRLLLFTPLVLFDSAGGPRPHLAAAWQWSDDRTTLTFTLRNDLQWHDGQPVRAEDAAWTLRIASDTLFAYGDRDEFASLRDVQVQDSANIVLTFAAPFVAELEPFAALPILPRHLLENVPPADFAKAPYHREPVGSGPFRFAGRLPDESVQLDRVPEFPEDLGRARVDRIVLRAIPEPSVQLTELQTGGVDACIMGSSRARDVEATGTARALLIPPLIAYAIPLNLRKPPLDDVRVRRALSAALDRAEIAAALSPVAKPARTFLTADAARWIDASLLQPDNDSAYAALQLDSAGWSTIGPDGIRRNARGQPLRIELVAPQALRASLTVVEAQWRALGVGTDLRFMEQSAYVGTIRNEQTRPAAMALSFVPDRIAHPDPSALLHSAGPSNLTSYRNAETDSLLLQLNKVLQDAQRAEIYRGLQRRVAEDVPILYLLNSSRILAVGPRLQDVRVDLNGPFSNAAEWWIPADRRRGAPAPAPAATTGEAR